MIIWDKRSEYAPLNPVVIPQWLYDQAKASGFDMRHYIVAQKIPIKD